MGAGGWTGDRGQRAYLVPIGGLVDICLRVQEFAICVFCGGIQLGHR